MKGLSTAGVDNSTRMSPDLTEPTSSLAGILFRADRVAGAGQADIAYAWRRSAWQVDTARGLRNGVGERAFVRATVSRHRVTRFGG